MGKKRYESKYIYTCPYCGNVAPFNVRYDKPIRCGFCKSLYTKDERVKTKV